MTFNALKLQVPYLEYFAENYPMYNQFVTLHYILCNNPDCFIKQY